MHRLLPLLLLATQAFSGEGHTLTLQIEGLKSTEGQLLVVLFDKADGYPDKADRAYRKLLVETVEAPVSTVVIEDVPTGTYAAFAVHDVNGNGIVDLRSVIPMPKEPIGASRNAKGFMGPPKFSGAAFEVGGDTTERFTLKTL